METKTEKKEMHAARLADLRYWIRTMTDSPDAPLESLSRLSYQDAHLLAAAMDNSPETRWPISAKRVPGTRRASA